jgi:hypothetical protein
MRNALGQFVVGHTGNAGGRPKDEYKVAELARSYTLEALETLVELMRSGKSERIHGTAAQALLDRGWGKPKREIIGEGSASFIDAIVTCPNILNIVHP